MPERAIAIIEAVEAAARTAKDECFYEGPEEALETLKQKVLLLLMPEAGGPQMFANPPTEFTRAS